MDWVLGNTGYGYIGDGKILDALERHESSNVI